MVFQGLQFIKYSGQNNQAGIAASTTQTARSVHPFVLPSNAEGLRNDLSEFAAQVPHFQKVVFNLFLTFLNRLLTF
jgi:hypothetical protein